MKIHNTVYPKDKCSRFGVMSTLLKVATIAITHLAMVLGVK